MKIQKKNWGGGGGGGPGVEGGGGVGRSGRCNREVKFL